MHRDNLSVSLDICFRLALKNTHAKWNICPIKCGVQSRAMHVVISRGRRFPGTKATIYIVGSGRILSASTPLTLGLNDERHSVRPAFTSLIGQ